jgi:hypothetical protein
MRYRMVLPAALLGAFLCGCAEREAAQAREVTTSVRDVFSPTEQLTWTGDREVYELPSSPPALDTQRGRTCLPWAKFKPRQIFNFVEEESRMAQDQPRVLARLDDTPWLNPRGQREPLAPVRVIGPEPERVIESMGRASLASWETVPELIPRRRDTALISRHEVSDDPCAPLAER